MNSLNFDKLLINTAFCFMASDGKIDAREIDIIRTMCAEKTLLNDFNHEINHLISKINKNSNLFISEYFDLLAKSSLTENEEILLIDFAIKTIKADNHIEYSEIKLFKTVRQYLSISNETILTFFPEIEAFLESDLQTKSNSIEFSNLYLNDLELPHFDFVIESNDKAAND